MRLVILSHLVVRRHTDLRFLIVDHVLGALSVQNRASRLIRGISLDCRVVAGIFYSGRVTHRTHLSTELMALKKQLVVVGVCNLIV